MFEILTDREREVLKLLSLGRSDREVADELVISVHTAKTHVRHILRKLEVRSRHQAADLYEDHQKRDITPRH
jgi:Response regulator containing a CheY-like receiver domain and an HTH DNA-binding domain